MTESCRGWGGSLFSDSPLPRPARNRRPPARFELVSYADAIRRMIDLLSGIRFEPVRMENRRRRGPETFCQPRPRRGCP